MACDNLVAFAGDRAPFGVHALDRVRAAKYMECCLEAGISWSEANRQLQNYLERKGCTPTEIATQLDIARPMLQLWLD
jgi:hypothetical protein